MVNPLAPFAPLRPIEPSLPLMTTPEPSLPLTPILPSFPSAPALPISNSLLRETCNALPPVGAPLASTASTTFVSILLSPVT